MIDYRVRYRHALRGAALITALLTANIGAAEARTQHAAAGDLLYVANLSQPKFSVDVYPLDKVLANKNPRPLQRIFGMPFPDSIGVDQSENFYVSDKVANAVFAFHKGRIQPFSQIRIGVSAPSALAVAQDGTLYVLNTSPKGANYVTVYAPKAGKPTLRLTKFSGIPTCLHVDASKNLYVGSVTASGTGALEEFAPGTTVGTPIPLQHLPGLTGIARDASGSYLITGTVDTQIAQLSVIDLYQGSSPSGQGMPNTAAGVVLTSDESAMLLAISSSAGVYAYLYPEYETSLAMLPLGLNTSVAAIAVSPADPN